MVDGMIFDLLILLLTLLLIICLGNAIAVAQYRLNQRRSARSRVFRDINQHQGKDSQ